MTPADLRDRYGLGPHTLTKPPDTLRDLVRALRIVTGAKVATVAAAIGCADRYLYLRMARARADRNSGVESTGNGVCHD